jgi:transketolase
MRNAFANEITEIVKTDDKLVLLSGDIGNRLFNDFKDNAPKQFFNCGVAEANMITVGAGMALSGMRPIAYTITPFITARCFEQIKLDVCYHKAPLIIVGVGAGLSYAALGPTHHSLEDIATLRMLPEMKIVCPGDAMEVRALIRAALKNDTPLYMRLGKKNEPVIHKEIPKLEIGKSFNIRKGSDVCILNTGNTLPVACEVTEILSEKNISARLESFHTVKPLCEETLTEAFEKYKLVITVEEHSRNGGLGGSVAEWLSDRKEYSTPLLRFGTTDKFLHESADQHFAREIFGLTANNIASTIISNL